MPDASYRLLKDIPQHPFLMIFSGTLMPKGSKATREHIPAGSNIGQGIWPTATGPGTVSKVAGDTFQRSGSACCLEGYISLFAHLLTTADERQFFGHGTVEEGLL